jgi:hypothetical protein
MTFTPAYPLAAGVDVTMDMQSGSPKNTIEHDKEVFDRYITEIGKVITKIDANTAKVIVEDLDKFTSKINSRIENIATVPGQDSLDTKKHMYKLMLERCAEARFRAMFRNLILTKSFGTASYPTVIKPIFENLHAQMVRLLVANSNGGFREYINDTLEEIFSTKIEGDTGEKDPETLLIENLHLYEGNVPTSDKKTYSAYVAEIENVLSEIPTIILTNSSMQSLKMMSNILSEHGNVGNIIMTLEKTIEWKKVFVYGGPSKLWKSGIGVNSKDFHYDGIVDPTQYNGNYDPRYELGYFQDQYTQSYYTYFIWTDAQGKFHCDNIRDVAKYGFLDLDFRNTENYKYDQSRNQELMYVLVGIIYFGKVEYLLKEGLNTMQNGPKTAAEIMGFVAAFQDTYDTFMQKFLQRTMFPTPENFNETSYLSGPGFVTVKDESLAINAGREISLLNKYRSEYDGIKTQIIEILKGAQNLQICGNVVSGSITAGGSGDINLSQAVDCQMNITTVANGGVENIPADAIPAIPAAVSDDAGSIPIPSVKAGSGLGASSREDPNTSVNGTTPTTYDEIPVGTMKADNTAQIVGDTKNTSGYYDSKILTLNDIMDNTMMMVVGGVVVVIIVLVIIILVVLFKPSPKPKKRKYVEEEEEYKSQPEPVPQIQYQEPEPTPITAPEVQPEETYIEQSPEMTIEETDQSIL